VKISLVDELTGITGSFWLQIGPASGGANKHVLYDAQAIHVITIQNASGKLPE
jgi:hypothetical protein